MNKLITCLLGLLLVQAVYSQREYFIYLQSEGGKPFFIRMNEQTFSSSGSGYLIMPRMRDSSYTFRVGWPSSPDAQAYFTIPVKGNDRGFLLKEFTGEGWGLFDLQSMEVLRAHAAPSGNSSVKLEPREVSGFTEVLSRAANDPTLKMREVPVTPPQKETVPPVQTEVKAAEPVITDTMEVVKTEAPEKKVIPETVTIDTLARNPDSLVIVENVTIRVEEEDPPPPAKTVTELPKDYSRSKVVRRSESSTTDGFSLVFIDEYADGHKDTIRITIPNAVQVWQKEEQKKPIAEEKKFLDIPVSAADTVAAEVKKNNCPSRAAEADFLKLRKKMASETTDDGMIREAKKAFIQKCYSVKQVRNLGTLFLNDAARFQFFEAAYPHITDLENFNSLGQDLKNEYYLRRFKAIL